MKERLWLLRGTIVVFSVIVLCCCSVCASETETEQSAFVYIHNPEDNPDAMRDIVVNPDAVYGYSPNPDSTRLGKYADLIDWTDPEQVAGAQRQRLEYFASTFLL